jgi:predicted dehydrogenase
LDTQMTIKLGVIGLSEGNGHPYSWAAICNGYSPEYMRDCEFPVITQYLTEQSWPDARIPGVQVTHIWTQEDVLSHRVAKASLISQVVDEPTAMLGKIDALLLARDDAENHLAFVEPFLKAGIPVYIDKPIALSLCDMDELYRLQQYEGQIFTCSALRYAKELMFSESDRERIGPVRYLQATTPKLWEKYAVHIIEPSLQIIGTTADIVDTRLRTLANGGILVSVDFDNRITADFTAFGKEIAAPLSIRIHGDRGWQELTFVDAFTAFKTALTEFVEGIRTKTCRSPIKFNRQVVSIIEAGLRK